ncbi:Tripartite tricarboxylate transporter family receptor [Xylophilus ampelinus]|nr:tripartite tricarboxylate transporter substrate binding protein [Variovorax sp.]VTY39804.1 Tripartite tricarboxylate transporter family receptor [Xylophilus ampelinus]|tara:strand:+ start:665 stop:1654 length:990 start_codon:yes stop_codon:yes gene_type:complete
MKTNNRRLIHRLALASACIALPVLPLKAMAQGATDYPNRPMELVVPFGAGGGTDALARVFADAMKKHFPQPITVINKPGASGAIGFGEVAASRPDGYKIGMISVEMAILPHMGVAKFTTDDFTPIVRLNADPLVLSVSADSPLKTIEDLVNAVKKRSEPMTFGNAGTGGVSHLAALALQQKLGTTFTHAPFQGNAPAIVALLGGHIDAVMSSPSEVATYVTGRKVRPLAVLADQRMPGMFEQVPTLKERKVDLTMGTWRGIAVPKGTPPEIVAKLTAASTQAANDPSVKESMERQSLGYAVADGETFRRQISSDTALFKQLIDQLGAKK